MIEAQHVTVRFGATTAVEDVSLTVPDEGVLGLVGPNGSGKTSLLRALHGALTPASGTVLLDGEPLHDLRRREIARHIAVVAQQPDAGTPVSVADLVTLGRLPHQGFAARVGEADRRIVSDALAAVGLTDLATRDVSALSGGERQRALIARALAQQAGHVLLDEPTNHLDIRFQHEVLRLVRGVPGAARFRSCSTTAARYCDRIVVLDHGRTVASGTPAEVLTPEVLEPVYGVRVKRVELDGELHLLF